MEEQTASQGHALNIYTLPQQAPVARQLLPVGQGEINTHNSGWCSSLTIAEAAVPPTGNWT